MIHPKLIRECWINIYIERPFFSHNYLLKHIVDTSLEFLCKIVCENTKQVIDFNFQVLGFKFESQKYKFPNILYIYECNKLLQSNSLRLFPVCSQIT
jgi:hypothetical protein